MTAAAVAALALSFGASTAIGQALADEPGKTAAFGLECDPGEGVLKTDRTLAVDALASTNGASTVDEAVADYLGDVDNADEAELFTTAYSEDETANDDAHEQSLIGTDEDGDVTSTIELTQGSGGSWLVSSTSVCTAGSDTNEGE